MHGCYLWLDYITEFERQLENATEISVRERIGNPTIRPLSDIPDTELKNELDQLLELLYANNIVVENLSANSRSSIKPGLHVCIVLKQDQHSGKLTEGIVKDILTKSPRHPHGIKVRLVSGEVGRVKEILD
jgi:uncharacterized repeat protein (TIGR03833 family)